MEESNTQSKRSYVVLIKEHHQMQIQKAGVLFSFLYCKSGIKISVCKILRGSESQTTSRIFSLQIHLFIHFILLPFSLRHCTFHGILCTREVQYRRCRLEDGKRIGEERGMEKRQGTRHRAEKQMGDQLKSFLWSPLFPHTFPISTVERMKEPLRIRSVCHSGHTVHAASTILLFVRHFHNEITAYLTSKHTPLK